MASFHDVTIDSVGGLGDGIARLNGKPVFIPKSCAGDVVRIRITQNASDFLRGQIVALLRAGEDRTQPPCAHYEACGGCGLQQLSANAYKTFKRKLLADALSHAGFAGLQADVVFLDAATRRRADFRLANGALAYHGLRSHELTPISHCLILEPQLQALLAPLASGLSALPITSVRVTRADSGLDMLLEATGSLPAAPFAQLAAQLGLARISVQDKHGIRTLHESAPVTMQLGGYDVALPPDGFLQAASRGQDVLAGFVLEHAQAGRIVDLFCGIGTYAFPLLAKARVHAVELQGEAIESVKGAIARYGLKERLSAQARDLFKNPLSAAELASYGCAVVNPPRAGAKAQVEAIAASGLQKLVMVSCNPASFARDAKTLKNAGFTLTHALGLDQFVWSPHLEIAAAFQR